MLDSTTKDARPKQGYRVYPREFKQQIVKETLEPGASVSIVAHHSILESFGDAPDSADVPAIELSCESKDRIVGESEFALDSDTDKRTRPRIAISCDPRLFHRKFCEQPSPKRTHSRKCFLSFGIEEIVRALSSSHFRQSLH
ncbi:transposase [Paraburkholderia sp. BL23I1N1]|nr:transposase [Paraburkholderia sp. BL23I1N1]